MQKSVEVEDLPEVLAREHLPEAIGDTCLVLPKRLFQWTVASVMILGAGIGMGLAAVLTAFIESDWIVSGFPLSLGIAWLIKRLVLDKEERQFLERVTNEGGAGENER